MSGFTRLGDMMGGVTGDAYARATPAQRRAYDAAAKNREVFAAWNAVMENERGRDHVTGLYYVADERRLVVYVDSPAWCQELFMMREVLRARLSFKGADLAEVVFKVSQEGYSRDSRLKKAARAKAPVAPSSDPAPGVPLDPREAAAIHAAVAPVADERLRQSLEKAMVASFEWKKGWKDVGAS